MEGKDLPDDLLMELTWIGGTIEYLLLGLLEVLLLQRTIPVWPPIVRAA